MMGERDQLGCRTLFAESGEADLRLVMSTGVVWSPSSEIPLGFLELPSGQSRRTA